LVGASTRIHLGKFEVIEPATVMLIGKITPAVGADRIPIYKILSTAVERVAAFTLRDASITADMNLTIHNSFSAPLDRPMSFYFPESATEARHIVETERGANDTVFCTGFAGLSPLEQLTMEVELAVTAPSNRAVWPAAIGTDVKVMAVRHNLDVDLTVCIPADPRFIHSAADYAHAIGAVASGLRQLVQRSPFPDAKLHINTKDSDGGMYLAPFGTSLGKSDCGAVGRGNRSVGFIAAYRPTNIEAPSGKNPLHHAGRLYTVAAQRLAEAIHLKCGLDCAVSIVARNGEHLASPAFVNIDICADNADLSVPRRVAAETIAAIDEISANLIHTDPISRPLPAPDAASLVK